MRIALTGSGGFLGKALMQVGACVGAQMVPLKLPRNAASVTRAELYDLLNPLNFDVLVHTAAARFPRSMDELAFNSELPGKLARAISETHPDARLIHISSLNVLIDQLRDSYSQSKRAGEKSLMIDEKISIVRPGLIWSSAGEGDAGRVEKVAALPMPWIPIPHPGPSFRPLDVNDMAVALFEYVIKFGHRRVVNIFGDTPVTLFQLIDNACAKKGKRALRVPTGWIFSLLPEFWTCHLPHVLRSFDCCDFDPASNLERGEEIILPFKLP